MRLAGREPVGELRVDGLKIIRRRLKASEEENLRRLVLFAVLTMIVVSCEEGTDTSGPEDQTDPVTSGSVADSEGSGRPESFDLDCEIIFEVHADFDASFEGYTTPQEAVESWPPGAGGIPDGDWTQFEDNKWVVVSSDGETVARARVEAWTGNPTTTFASERYVVGGIEYCE
jgi:hypothetical protein